MTYLINYVFQLNQDLNIHVFNMIAGKNKSKILRKDMSCKCKCKFDGRMCNSNQKWVNEKCRCKWKNIIYVKKIIFRILLHVAAKMENV